MSERFRAYWAKQPGGPSILNSLKQLTAGKQLATISDIHQGSVPTILNIRATLQQRRSHEP